MVQPCVELPINIILILLCEQCFYKTKVLKNNESQIMQLSEGQSDVKITIFNMIVLELNTEANNLLLNEIFEHRRNNFAKNVNDIRLLQLLFL